MTLSLAVVSATDETPTISVPEPDTSRVKLEPRCRVCQNDGVRQKVNELLASGATYAMTRRALGDAAGDVTADSIRRHAERHFPVQNAARATYREILERRAQENSVDFVDGVATAITPVAYLETIMVKGYEKLVDQDTEVDVKTGMQAACRLQEMIDSHGDQADWAKAHAEMGRLVEVVRAFVPSERWPELQAALRGEAPIEDLGAEKSEGLEMVE